MKMEGFGERRKRNEKRGKESTHCGLKPRKVAGIRGGAEGCGDFPGGPVVKNPPSNPLLVARLCPALCDPMNWSPPGFSVHGILRARKLEWVAIPFSRGSSRRRD